MGREEDQERVLKDYLKSDAWKTIIDMSNNGFHMYVRLCSMCTYIYNK